MNELEFYDGAYTGQQIDSAIGKVVNADATPTLNSTNMITSGGVKSAIEAAVDGLFTMLKSSLNGGKTMSVAFSTTNPVFNCLIFFQGTSGGRLGIYNVYGYSTNAAGHVITKITGGNSPDFTITQTSSGFNITNTGSGVVRVTIYRAANGEGVMSASFS